MVNKGVGLEMFEAIIYNISVMVAGIYLFHRLQYSENKKWYFQRIRDSFNDTRFSTLSCISYSI